MALSKTVLAIIVIVILVIAGIGAYTLSFSASTVTVTTTVTQGTGGTVTSTTTVTTTVTSGGGTLGLNTTLVDLAKAEGGTVTCYCVMDTGDWPTMNAILTKEFPWIHVNYVGLSPGDIATRAKTEYQAGHPQADFVVDSALAIATLIPVGAVHSFYNPMETFNNETGYGNWLHPAFGLPLGIIWNTNLIKDNSTLPKSFWDLSNPAWKGKLAFDAPSSLNGFGPLFATLGHSTTNQSFSQWLNAVKANNPIITASAGDVYTDVSTGQVAIGLGYINDYIGGIGKAPVGWEIPGNTVYYSPVYSALLTGAAHPYTAELMIQWFSSYSGAIALANTGRMPAFTPVANQMFGSYFPAGSSLIGIGSGTDMYTNGTEWINFYTSIFGQ